MPPGAAEIEVRVPRVFCAADGSFGNPLGVVLDGPVGAGRRPPGARPSPRLLGDGLRRRRRERPDRDLHARGRAAVRRPPVRRYRLAAARRGLRARRAAAAGGEVQVRRDGELTWVAARPEWCPAWELVEHGSAAEIDALPVATEGFRYVWAWIDEDAGHRPRPLLRPRGRHRRGRGDRLGGAAALRPARPADRGPPGQRLGDPRAPARRRHGRDRRAGGGGLKIPGDRPTIKCPRRGSNSRPTD